MKVVYSPRSIRDLERIAARHRKVADIKTARAIADRIEFVINRLVRHPKSAPGVADRSGVRVVLVLRYPYKIFYRLREDAVEILHVRHTARRSWKSKGQ